MNTINHTYLRSRNLPAEVVQEGPLIKRMAEPSAKEIEDLYNSRRAGVGKFLDIMRATIGRIENSRFLKPPAKPEPQQRNADRISMLQEYKSSLEQKQNEMLDLHFDWARQLGQRWVILNGRFSVESTDPRIGEVKSALDACLDKVKAALAKARMPRT